MFYGCVSAKIIAIIQTKHKLTGIENWCVLTAPMIQNVGLDCSPERQRLLSTVHPSQGLLEGSLTVSAFITTKKQNKRQQPIRFEALTKL